MNLEWVRYEEVKGVAQNCCALCGEPVESDEMVLANFEARPITWLCPYCVEAVVEAASD